MNEYSPESNAAMASRFINGTHRHVFLTGRAGTGKTTFLKHIQQHTHKKSIVAAPTGIAAINAGGVTLHSLFQLPFGSFLPVNEMFQEGEISIQLNTPASLAKSFQMNKVKREMLREMELLIIDEVSMLRADLLDAIDVVLRMVRKIKHRPFGGVQILFIGDMLQLPPVVKRGEMDYLAKHYKNLYFFEAHALRDHKPVYIELEKIFRQTDKQFITILNHLRDNVASRQDIEALNQYHDPKASPGENEGFVFITTHNRKADAINNKSLQQLPGKSYFFKARVEGDFPDYMYPIDYRLELKHGAQVMFIKNDYSGAQRYFNGKIGKISRLDNDEIEVSFDDGSQPTSVEMYTWENKKYSLDKENNEIKEDVKGSFSHLPLKLAWAITVHKSQGLTFQKAIIDVSEAFAPGQVYVALSRLVSLDGLVLNARLPADGMEPDEAIRSFASEKKDGQALEQDLSLSARLFIRDFTFEAFDFKNLYWVLYNHKASYDKDVKRSAKQQYRGWAASILEDFKPVKDVGDKFLNQVKRMYATGKEVPLETILERSTAALKYFEPLFKSFSERIFAHIKSVGTEKGVKKYKNELHDLERQFHKQLQAMHKALAIVQSAIENTELSREDLRKQSVNQERQEITPGKEKTKKEPKPKKPKPPKGQTKEISLKMFREGKSVEEVAAERSLAVSTIEAHLAYFVGEGVLEAEQFVEEFKIAPVIKVSEELDTFHLGPIKEKLGDEYSYSDLRFIMAAHKYKQSLQAEK